MLYRCRAGWCINWFDSSKQPATINPINHRTGTTMQLLSAIPGFFSRKKAASDLREQARDERLDGLRKVIDQMAARWDEAGMPPVSDKDAAVAAPVYDADHDLQIMGILGVNAKAAWVLVADLPVQLTEHGHIKSRRLRFTSIIEFKPNDQGSGSFHCYGRLPDGKEGV